MPLNRRRRKETDSAGGDAAVPPAIFLAGFAAFLLWSCLYLRIALNADMGWLFMVAGRFWEGGTYTQDFRETNPPLSFLIYLPAVFIHKATGIPVYFAIYFSMLAYIAVSVAALAGILRRTDMTPAARFALAAGFVFAATWLMGTAFGQRDHLVFVWLAPAVLAHYQLTKGAALPVFTTLAAGVPGALAVCLKPHYILIPAALFIHRAWVSRSLSAVLKSADFWCYAVTGTGYMLFVALVFPDYLTVILPEVKAFYLPEEHYSLLVRLPFLLYTALAALILYFSATKKEAAGKRIAWFLCAMSFLSVLPYLLQGKGFYYHIMPALGFGGMACIYAFWNLPGTRMGPYAALLTALPAMMLLSYPVVTGITGPFLTHREFRDMELHRKIANHAEGKNFVIYSLAMPPYLSLPHYYNMDWASRFPFFWQLDALIEQSPAPLEDVGIARYVGLAAEDLERYRPEIVAVPRYREKSEEDFLAFLLHFKTFQSSWEKYDYIETVPLEESEYHKGTGWARLTHVLPFELYKRRP